MNKIFLAQQMNRFVQMSVQSANLTDEKAMEVADLYPEWATMKAYPENEIVTQRLLFIRKSASQMKAFLFGHSRLGQQMPI